ncbi:MAG: hypothetical protein NVS4B8_06940 [Herpetosiphon sp.]
MKPPITEQAGAAPVQQDVRAGLPPKTLAVDRSFVFLILGSIGLILVALISIPLLAQRPQVLAPADTPEGTVQRFYQAIYNEDYHTAYGFLTTKAQDKLSLDRFQQDMQGELKHSQMVVSHTSVHDETATVDITLHYVRSGGLFSDGSYDSSHSVLLTREGNDWKIARGPFYRSFWE